MQEPGPGVVPEEEIDEAGLYDERSDKLIRFMDRVHADQVFGSEESKRAYINDLTYDSFRELLVATNSTLRDISIHNRAIDGESVTIADVFNIDPYIPPLFKDKDGLLQEMFIKAKAMNADGRSLEDIATLLAMSINAIHPFADANGRTTRVLYSLLAFDYTGEKQEVAFVRELLGKYGRETLDTAPTANIMDAANSMLVYELGLDPNDRGLPSQLLEKILVAEDGTKSTVSIDKTLSAANISEENKQFIDSVVNQHAEGGWFEHGFLAVYRFLKDRNQETNYIQISKKSDGFVFRTTLSANDIIESLTDEDVNTIRNDYREIKQQYVRYIMDTTVNPDSYLAEGDGATTLLAEAKLETERRYFERTNLQPIKGVVGKEELPYSSEVISGERMAELIEIRNTLNEFIDRDKLERDALNFDMAAATREFEQRCSLELSDDIRDYKQAPEDSNEIRDDLTRRIEARRFQIQQEVFGPLIEVSSRNLEMLVGYLDGLDIWKNKFSTRNAESLPRSFYSELQLESTDSVYYTTDEGVSLRLAKHYLITDGLKTVVQPYMEKSFYVDPRSSNGSTFNGSSEVPEVDKRVVEYSTNTFYKALASVPSDYDSRIRHYVTGDDDIYLNPVDGFNHISYPINRVFGREQTS